MGRVKKMSKEVTWNNEQLSAISARNGNYLVSASAGSGKTAVLTERVYELIKEGTNLDELLILTFTDNAAKNMRNKIRDKLNENHFEKLASLIDAVNIQTFDAFALSIVKKYHYLINLSADIKIVDQNLITLQKKKILDKIFLHKYETNDKAFLEIIKKYCLDSDESIRDLVLLIDSKSDLKFDKNDILDKYENEYLSKEYISRNIDSLFKETIQKFDDLISLAKTFENSEFADALIGYLSSFVVAKDFDELTQINKNPDLTYPTQRKKSMSLKGTSDERKNNYILMVKKNLLSLFDYDSKDEIIARCAKIKPYVSTLVNLVKELNVELDAYKKEYSIYTFQDIFKFAMKILKVDEVKNKLKRKYRFIMIDEYQDTSDLQEEFIASFANDNVYVVGDVKQSIYRFRNANCDLFLSKFNSYPLYDKSHPSKNNRIDLPRNYRSRVEVLDTVNELFLKIMSKKDTNLDYSKDHMMYSGNDALNAYKSPSYEYTSEVISYDKREDMTDIEYEARLVASDIINKINSKIKINEKGVIRDISYKDFAILSYTKSEFKIYQKIFEEYKIPLFAKYNESIHESDLTLVIENIIKAIVIMKENNEVLPDTFTHPFVSIMRSFLFSETDEEIEDVLSRKIIKDTKAYKSLKKTMDEIEGKNLKETIVTIINNFDVYQKAITIGGISKSIELLDYYYLVASQMDDMRFSLIDFRDYLIELNEFDIEPDYESSDSTDDSVKLLSIHASKGLEYRFVYFVRLNKQFGKGRGSTSMLVDNVYGIDLPDYSYVNPFNLNHHLILRKENNESLLEQLRVFYVALTRAQEQLIFVSKNNYKKTPPSTLFEAKCYQDFIYLADLSLKPISVDIYNAKRIENAKSEPDIDLHLFSEVNLSNEVFVNKRASKEVSDASSELLALGNKYHYYLELIDFKNIDTSFIKDSHDKYLIDRFLSNPIFHKEGLEKVAHEYSFYDEVNQIHGIIDLMLIYKDHIDIIDFKLSHVDDEAYEKQVGIYKDYVSQISSLPISTYVTGIMSGEIKKVS